MNKTWRNQKVYNNENKVSLTHSSVAELWWEAFNKVDKMSFNSSESEKHQLDPFNYGLSIPSKSNLDKYDKKEAISSLFGEGNKNNLEEKESVATIYHELFHVFQTNSTKKTLDYFYFIDDLQKKRTELLEYLGYANFYTLSEATNSNFGKTIFHSVENYEKLGNKESFSFMSNEAISERNKEIDEDIEKFILEYGESYRSQFEEQGQSAKKSFRNTIEEQIDDNVSIIKEQAQEIKRYSDLSRSHIEELIEFFKLYKDTNLHLFHLIEGSAQIFGWCCAGYNIDEKFALRKKDLEKENSSQSDTYERAYELFKEYGGKTPLLFIIISLFSLSSGKSIDVFILCLEKVKTLEKDLETLLIEQEITSDIFTLITLKLLEQIENSIRGHFYNANSNSVHDREKEDSIFLKSINRIRKITPKSNKLEFLIDFVLDENIVLALIESFESHEEEFKDDLRKNEVMRDFEQFLRYGEKEINFELICCSKHKKIKRFIMDKHKEFIWKVCDEKNCFKDILLNNFKVTVPNILINE